MLLSNASIPLLEIKIKCLCYAFASYCEVKIQKYIYNICSIVGTIFWKKLKRFAELPNFEGFGASGRRKDLSAKIRQDDKKTLDSKRGGPNFRRFGGRTHSAAECRTGPIVTGLILTFCILYNPMNLKNS